MFQATRSTMMIKVVAPSGCDDDIPSAKILFASVVSLSGTAMFQGTRKRLTRNLTAVAPSTMRIRWLLHQREKVCGLQSSISFQL